MGGGGTAAVTSYSTTTTAYAWAYCPTNYYPMGMAGQCASGTPINSWLSNSRYAQIQCSASGNHTVQFTCCRF